MTLCAAAWLALLPAVQGVQKKKQKKKATKTLASLDSLAAELGHISAAAGGSSSKAGAQPSEQQQALLLAGKGTKSSIKRSKARLAVGVTESARLQKVLQHPSYKADPFQVCVSLCSRCQTQCLPLRNSNNTAG